MSGRDVELLAQRLDYLAREVASLKATVAGLSTKYTRMKLVFVGVASGLLGFAGSHPSVLLQLVGIM